MSQPEHDKIQLRNTEVRWLDTIEDGLTEKYPSIQYEFQKGSRLLKKLEKPSLNQRFSRWLAGKDLAQVMIWFILYIIVVIVILLLLKLLLG